MDRRERYNDPNIALLAALQGWQAKLWTALPAIITSFNPTANTCAVQAALKAKQLHPDGTEVWVDFPPFVDCPVIFPGGGGFTITFPLQPGDECLVVFASRCIDAWWQSGGVQQQLEFRMHDLSDGFVLPGVRSKPKVPGGISTSNVELRTDDAASKISITPAHEIIIVTSANVSVAAPTVSIEGETTITGNLTVSGTIQAPTITGTTSVSVGGTELAGHTHGGVSTGSGFTGGPA